MHEVVPEVATDKTGEKREGHEGRTDKVQAPPNHQRQWDAGSERHDQSEWVVRVAVDDVVNLSRERPASFPVEEAAVNGVLGHVPDNPSTDEEAHRGQRRRK